jgi:hypothetical protein
MNVNAQPTYANSAAAIYDFDGLAKSQAQVTFVWPEQLDMVGLSRTPPALDRLTEAIEHSHYPNWPFTETGTAGYTNQSETNATIHQPLR